MDNLTPRERVVRAIRHQEPDRVPIDLGAMDSTGITAKAYQRLKDHLGITAGIPKVIDPYQQVVIVEEAVLQRVRADVLPVPLGPANGGWGCCRTAARRCSTRPVADRAAARR